MKRNRAQTEQRLIQAALAILQDTGFIEFGVNSISARAGMDKVLIYRYFGGAEGLMETIAREYRLYPRLQDIPGGNLGQWLEAFRKQFLATPLAHMLHHWEGVLENPLTRAYRRQRQEFWEQARIHLNPPTPAAHTLIDLLMSLSPDDVHIQSLSDLLQAVGWDAATIIQSPENSDSQPNRDVEDLPTNLL